MPDEQIEPSDDMLDVYLDGFTAGFMSSLASVGAPPDFCFNNAQACVEAMEADPLIMERVRAQVRNRINGLEPDGEGLEMMTVKKYDNKEDDSE